MVKLLNELSIVLWALDSAFILLEGYLPLVIIFVIIGVIIGYITIEGSNYGRIH